MFLENARKRYLVSALANRDDDVSGASKKSYFEEFCQNTSIHGMKYLTQKRRSSIGKAAWSAIIIVSVLLCCTFIKRAYKQWNDTPVIVTFATEQTLISEIPFPAVTICPLVKANRTICNYTDILLKTANLQHITPQERQHFEYISLVCSFQRQFPSILVPNRTYNDSLLDFLYKVSPSAAKIFLSVKWKHMGGPGLFKSILTAEGFCYTFNMLEPHRIFRDDVDHYYAPSNRPTCWSLQTGYYNCRDSRHVYPENTNAVGANAGLRLILRTEEEDADQLCVSHLQGFKINFHNPAEIPDISEEYFLIPLDQTVVGLIKPNMMKTHRSLISYSPEKRKCYFEGEKHLKYFKSYNQENCVLECRANYTLKWCGCVEFYMPRTENTPICSIFHGACIESIKVTYMNKNFKKKIVEHDHYHYMIKEVNLSRLLEQEDMPCNCMPSCTSLDYEVELSQTQWNWKGLFRVLSEANSGLDLNKIPKARLSTLILFFKDMQFMTQERTELYGKGQLLANWGGLLGLFMGFSLISMFEVVYFLVLKWIACIKQHGRKWWIVLLALLMVSILVLCISFVVQIAFLVL